MAILATGRDVTHGLDVDGLRRAEDPISEAAYDGFFHVQKGHHVEQLLDLQGSNVFFNLEDTRYLRRQQVVTTLPPVTITPLSQADDCVGVTASGQQEMGQGLGHVPAQVPGVIRDQETNEQVPQAGRVFLVAEGCMDHVPEGLGQIEFFNEVPAGWWCAQVDVCCSLDVGPGVKQGTQDSKKFRLVSLDHHRQHL